MPDPNARTWRLPGGASITLHFAKPGAEAKPQSPDQLCTSVTLTTPDGASIALPLIDDEGPPTWNAALPQGMQ